MKALQTLFQPECKYLLYGGAMAGGKSYLLRWAALSYLIYIYGKTGIKNVPIGLFSEDYPTLKDRQIGRIKREFPPWIGELKETRDEGFAFILKDQYGGGRIMLRNLDDPAKYMSTEFAGEFVEELTRTPEQTFKDLRNRLRYPGIDEVKFMGASNPGGIGHGYVKKYFVDQIAEDPEIERFFYVHANVYDNKYISPDYIKQLESLPEQQRKAYLEGSWDVFEGQYFTAWNTRLHVCNPFLPDKRMVIVGGLDWGRVDNFSFHLTEISRIDVNGTHFFRSRVFFEVYGKDHTVREWSDIIKEKLKTFNLKLSDVAWVRADTQIWNKGLDGQSLDIYSQFTQADPSWLILRMANKDRIGGWENLQRWFSLATDGYPYLQIASNCKNAIRLIPNLVHDEIKKEDVDQKGENDAADSLRYMHMALKWIDANVGGAYHPSPNNNPMKIVPQFIGEKQLSTDLDAWSDPHGSNEIVGGASH